MSETLEPQVNALSLGDCEKLGGGDGETRAIKRTAPQLRVCLEHQFIHHIRFLFPKNLYVAFG